MKWVLADEVVFTYTNWRGETAERRVAPLALEFGSNEWHTEEQWLLHGQDLDKAAERTFAMKNISNWRPV